MSKPICRTLAWQYRALGAMLIALLAASSRAQPTTAPAAGHWVGAWGASPIFAIGADMNHQTIRQVVRLSIGGQAVRLRISNEMGTAPLSIGSAYLSLPGSDPGSIDSTSGHIVTFDGKPSITIPPGAPALSDPVPIVVKPLESVSIDLFVPRDPGPAATHPLAFATTYTAAGEHVGETTLPSVHTNTSRYFLTGVQVNAPDGAAIVALGDSITDGAGSTLDANHRWPDVLADRLAAAGTPMGMVNAGISGNRVLHDLPEAQFGPSALARFDRDVLTVPNVKTIILMESINDIGHSGSAGLPEQKVSADEIELGLHQLADRAHAHSIRILGATLTPFADTTFTNYFTLEGEQTRQSVNQWIRSGGVFDGVIDFDAALRDPAKPDHLLGEYDLGDHLHPNDAGYKKMAEAIDLNLLHSP